MAVTPCNEAFYAEQGDGSLRSARAYLGHLFGLWRPESAIDVGCGRGARCLTSFGAVPTAGLRPADR